MLGGFSGSTERLVWAGADATAYKLIFLFMYVCAYVCVYVCINIFIYKYIYMGLFAPTNFPIAFNLAANFDKSKIKCCFNDFICEFALRHEREI